MPVAASRTATAVWVGTVDNSALTNSWGGLMYGSGMPARIWKSTMDQALEGEPNEDFPEPKDMGYSSTPYVYAPPSSGGNNDASEEEAPAEEMTVDVPPVEEAPAAPPADTIELAPGIVIPNIFG